MIEKQRKNSSVDFISLITDDRQLLGAFFVELQIFRRRPVLDFGTARQFLTYTRDLTFVMEPGRKLNARCWRKLGAAGIPVRYGRVKRVRASEERIERVVLDDGAELRPDYIFSLYGSDPRTELLRALPVALTRTGHVRIDDKNRTNLPTFFAAGDVSDRYGHQVATAVHEGATAALGANHVLYPSSQRV